jgi:hypothetical protein
MVLRKKNRETGDTDLCGLGFEDWSCLEDGVSSNYLDFELKLFTY